MPKSASAFLPELVKQLVNTKGINAKKAILESLDDIQTASAEKFFAFVLDPRISLYQSEIVKVSPMLSHVHKKTFLASHPDPCIIDACMYVYGKSLTGATRGKQGQALISAVHDTLAPEYQPLFNAFILRDLKCGIGIKTINTVWEDSIFYSPYQQSESGKLKQFEGLNWIKGVYAQIKADGMFFNGLVNAEFSEVMITSRKGTIIDSPALADLKDDLAELARIAPDSNGSGHNFHGELVVLDAVGNTLPREVGNGMLNSMIQTGVDLPIGCVVQAKIWDVMSQDDYRSSTGKKNQVGLPYCDKFTQLEYMFSGIVDLIACELVENRILHSFAEVAEYFKEALARGEEGLIVKDPDLVWFDGKSDKSLKMKIVMHVDLFIVGLNDGDKNGRHADTFGSLQCESSCGKLAVGVHGMSDILRQEIFDNFESKWKGGIITCECNGVQENSEEGEKGEIKSLFLPRLKSELRLDKDEADSLDQIREIEQSTIQNGGKPLPRKV